MKDQSQPLSRVLFGTAPKLGLAKWLPLRPKLDSRVDWVVVFYVFICCTSADLFCCYLNSTDLWHWMRCFLLNQRHTTFAFERSFLGELRSELLGLKCAPWDLGVWSDSHLRSEGVLPRKDTMFSSMGMRCRLLCRSRSCLSTTPCHKVVWTSLCRPSKVWSRWCYIWLAGRLRYRAVCKAVDQGSTTRAKWVVGCMCALRVFRWRFFAQCSGFTRYGFDNFVSA